MSVYETIAFKTSLKAGKGGCIKVSTVVCCQTVNGLWVLAGQGLLLTTTCAQSLTTLRVMCTSLDTASMLWPASKSKTGSWLTISIYCRGSARARERTQVQPQSQAGSYTSCPCCTLYHARCCTQQMQSCHTKHKLIQQGCLRNIPSCASSHASIVLVQLSGGSRKASNRGSMQTSGGVLCQRSAALGRVRARRGSMLTLALSRSTGRPGAQLLQRLGVDSDLTIYPSAHLQRTQHQQLLQLTDQ